MASAFSNELTQKRTHVKPRFVNVALKKLEGFTKPASTHSLNCRIFSQSRVESREQSPRLQAELRPETSFLDIDY